ncbi:hypothetical protein [Larkinella soli]|uniref:hypothetical protein n=1 Tax=Larkinella soli TaxID=1770527 RepID=UPI000FFC10E8|nr:hypothetical protein [Larkinella soli]
MTTDLRPQRRRVALYRGNAYLARVRFTLSDGADPQPVTAELWQYGRKSSMQPTISADGDDTLVTLSGLQTGNLGASTAVLKIFWGGEVAGEVELKGLSGGAGASNDPQEVNLTFELPDETTLAFAMTVRVEGEDGLPDELTELIEENIEDAPDFRFMYLIAKMT